MSCVSVANAGVSVSSGVSAPTYSNTLNFDEVGGPTGSVAGNAWAGLGVSSLIGGSGDVFVGALGTNPGWEWLGSSNVVYAPWGIFSTFSQPLTAFSCQYWDSSGPATFMGGGALVVALNGGVEVGSVFLDEPAYGGIGNEWINITTTGGSTFDEVRLVGFGFFPEAYADNFSWNTVPAPSAAGVLAVGGLLASRRRRA
jgi:hypothetical protein